MLGDVAAAAVADPGKCGKLAYLLVWLLVCANERAEQLQRSLGLFLAEFADEQLQPLPRVVYRGCGGRRCGGRVL